MGRHNKNYFQYFILSSLFLHLMFVITPEFQNKKRDQLKINTAKRKLQFISLSNLSPRQISLIKQDRPKNQVVNSESKASTPIKVKTRFLGKKTQSFHKQTIARHTGAFKAAGRGVEQQKATEQNKKSHHSKPKGLTLKNLGIGNMLLGQAQAEIRPHNFRSGQKHGQLNKRGVAQSNDFINDIPLGDTTYLNTVEFKFFGFYERIRKRLEIFWGKSIQQKARQIISRGGRIPASRNLMTSLLIDINNQGVITNIRVKGSSGFRELDAAAIESFNQAGPFPNPPKEMVKEGKATLEWGFVVNS